MTVPTIRDALEQLVILRRRRDAGEGLSIGFAILEQLTWDEAEAAFTSPPPSLTSLESQLGRILSAECGSHCWVERSVVEAAREMGATMAVANAARERDFRDAEVYRHLAAVARALGFKSITEAITVAKSALAQRFVLTMHG